MVVRRVVELVEDAAGSAAHRINHIFSAWRKHFPAVILRAQYGKLGEGQPGEGRFRTRFQDGHAADPVCCRKLFRKRSFAGQPLAPQAGRGSRTVPRRISGLRPMRWLPGRPGGNRRSPPQPAVGCWQRLRRLSTLNRRIARVPSVRFYPQERRHPAGPGGPGLPRRAGGMRDPARMA